MAKSVLFKLWKLLKQITYYLHFTFSCLELPFNLTVECIIGEVWTSGGCALCSWTPQKHVRLKADTAVTVLIKQIILFLRGRKRLCHLFRFVLCSPEDLFSARMCPHKLCEQKENCFYILTSQTDNKVCLVWWARKIRLLLWHVWHDCHLEQNVLRTPEHTNCKYMEPKEIHPSKSKYLHTIRAESWDM